MYSMYIYYNLWYFLIHNDWVSIPHSFVALLDNCGAVTCAEGFLGSDCKCWCDSGDKYDLLKECDGSSGK